MKKKLETALFGAANYFIGDRKRLGEITRIQKDLKREDCSLAEAQNVVCNLSLIAIAETGFDLCGKPYFLKHPELNVIYRICSRTKKGQKVIESLNNKDRKGA